MISFNGVAFRDPDFGDTNSLSFNRINRETRGGDIIIINPYGVDGRQLIRYTWTTMWETDAIKLKAIIANSLGRRISLLDYNSVSQFVIIMNPNTEIAQTGPQTWSASLDMAVVP